MPDTAADDVKPSYVFKKVRSLSTPLERALMLAGGDIDRIFAVFRDGERVGYVIKRSEPLVVNGQTLRWRALFGGAWIDIGKRREFVDVYERITNR
jgi:hypothetical protein